VGRHEGNKLGRVRCRCKIILKEKHVLDSVDSGHGTLADSCKHNNKLSCTINGRNLLTSLGATSYSVMHILISP
jgi:hypothetical protein